MLDNPDSPFQVVHYTSGTVWSKNQEENFAQTGVGEMVSSLTKHAFQTMAENRSREGGSASNFGVKEKVEELKNLEGISEETTFS